MMSEGSNQVVFTGTNVLLTGQGSPQPATIIVNAAAGKISDVRPVRCAREDFPTVSDSNWVDAGENLVLPGLVE